jgi:hypothetical protein
VSYGAKVNTCYIDTVLVLRFPLTLEEMWPLHSEQVENELPNNFTSKTEETQSKQNRGKHYQCTRRMLR